MRSLSEGTSIDALERRDSINSLMTDYWSRTQADRGLSDDELKASVVKNQETVALVGAMVMTITFTVHVQNDAIIDASIGIRYMHICWRLGAARHLHLPGR